MQSQLRPFQDPAVISGVTESTADLTAQEASNLASEAASEPQTEAISDPSTYEATHVHAVYQQIAPHFSSTRYRPWPIVSSFLNSLPPGSVGLDIGCGNGKYLTVRRDDIFIVASDRSSELLKFAAHEPDRQPHDGVVVADVLDLPHQNGVFDFAISIAVVHHLSSRKRRVAATRAILDTLKLGEQGNGGTAGQMLLYVWALEQKTSRRGWDKGHVQDVMVPWVMKGSTGQAQKKCKKPKSKKGNSSDSTIELAQSQAKVERISQCVDDLEAEAKTSETTFHRYYHLYQEGELEEDIAAAGGVVLDSGYEKDNWWAIATPDAVTGIDVAGDQVLLA